MKMKTLRFNGHSFDVNDDGATRYDEKMVLTDDEKAKARENIGAAAVGESGGTSVTADSIKEALGYNPANVEDVFESTLHPMFTNLFDTVGIEYGKLLNSDGSVTDTGVSLAVTDFIPVKAGQTVRMEGFSIYTGSSSPCINLYGADYVFKTHLKNSGFVSSTYYLSDLETDEKGNYVKFTVKAPASLAYIRICTHTEVIGNNPVLTVDEEIEYEMGYGLKMNPKVKVDYDQVINSPQKNGWSILPNEHINIAYSSIGRKPINTIEHFIDAAKNYDYNALKCDVRPTSDGELILCHDAGFTFDDAGHLTAYDSGNATLIHDVTAETCLAYSFSSGEHPCLVGEYLDVCRKYGKVAFITIRNEYMDVVIPKLLFELKKHNMKYSAIINCMTYESLVTWRTFDKDVMVNYTLNYGASIDAAAIDKAIALGYCSLCGFNLSSSSAEPIGECDFEYAWENGIRLLQAIAYVDGSPEACYGLGYDGCQIAFPWS